MLRRRGSSDLVFGDDDDEDWIGGGGGGARELNDVTAAGGPGPNTGARAGNNNGYQHFGDAHLLRSGNYDDIEDVDEYPGDDDQQTGGKAEKFPQMQHREDLFPFDGEEELHFDVEDTRKRRFSGHGDAPFWQWIAVLGLCLLASAVLFFLLSLRAHSLTRGAEENNEQLAIIPVKRNSILGRTKTAFEIPPSRDLRRNAVETALEDEEYEFVKPNAKPKGIPLSDKLKKEAIAAKAEAKDRRRKNSDSSSSSNRIVGPGQRPADKVNALMKKRLEKLREYVAAGRKIKKLGKQPRIFEQTEDGPILVPDPLNSPQPAPIEPTDEVVDYGWRFDNPEDISQRFGSKEEHIIDLCQGRSGKNDLPHAEGTKLQMFVLTGDPKYADKCLRAFAQEFLRDPVEEHYNPDLLDAKDDLVRQAWRQKPKRLRWGDFQSIHFMFPDGERAPLPRGREILPNGFVTDTNQGERRVQAGTTNTQEILEAVESMVSVLRQGVVQGESGKLLFLTTHISEEVVDGRKVDMHTLVFYALVGQRDIMPVNEQQTRAMNMRNEYTPNQGAGVWKVQVARDDRGHDICPGSMIQIFDTLMELRHSIWPELDIVLILDASWSYATGQHQGSNLEAADKQEWLKHSAHMRDGQLALAKLNEQVTRNSVEGLKIRARILEGVKTPGRNCYLAPYLTPGGRYRRLTRLAAVTNQWIQEYDGHMYPQMRQLGSFPGINYYITDLGPTERLNFAYEKPRWGNHRYRREEPASTLGGRRGNSAHIPPPGSNMDPGPAMRNQGQYYHPGGEFDDDEEYYNNEDNNNINGNFPAGEVPPNGFNSDNGGYNDAGYYNDVNKGYPEQP
ncbi:unnamed protein product [Amoebophrya sp. A25]|nr:unnamed protein product [Amoebophrya sp. A25]|eukprot:GSA25T00007609001.1